MGIHGGFIEFWLVWSGQRVFVKPGTQRNIVRHNDRIPFIMCIFDGRIIKILNKIFNKFLLKIFRLFNSIYETKIFTDTNYLLM